MNDLGNFLWCYRCGANIARAPRGRRQARVHVTGTPGFFGGTNVTYEHYELVTMCMPCWEAEEEADRSKRRRTLYAVSGTGLGVLVWVYTGTLWLVGCVVLGLGAAFFWRRPRALIQVERKGI